MSPLLRPIVAMMLLATVAACNRPAEVPTHSPPAPTSSRQVIVGKVIAIADGDTLTLRDGEENHRVRLLGIDCPEAGQDYGNRAKQALGAAVAGQTVRVEWAERDRYGRILGDVYLGDRWINRELVAEGWAWHFVRYSDDKQLAAAEVEAREAKRGLWADPNRPVPPWEYRRPPQGEITGYWLNTSSGVRHNSNCRMYRNTSKGRECEATEGTACGICGG